MNTEQTPEARAVIARLTQMREQARAQDPEVNLIAMVYQSEAVALLDEIERLEAAPRPRSAEEAAAYGRVMDVARAARRGEADTLSLARDDLEALLRMLQRETQAVIRQDNTVERMSIRNMTLADEVARLRPRTVTELEELHHAPEGMVIRTAHGDVHVASGIEYPDGKLSWFWPGSEMDRLASEDWLPAVVLQERKVVTGG